MEIVVLSTSTLGDADLGAVRRRAQWARAALRRGDRVMFVEAAASDNPFTHPNLTRNSLTALGFSERALRRAWHGLDPENSQAWHDAFGRALDAFEARAPQTRVVIIADPFIPFATVVPMLQQRGYRMVYDCLDDFEALAALGYVFENMNAERYLLETCELTIVVSTVLQDKLRARAPHARIELLPQGFDRAAFPAPSPHPSLPADLARGTRTLGFWGHVNDFNIDTELLTHVARVHPDWSIILLGPVDSDTTRPPVGAALRAAPNIHLLGPKRHDALASYLAWFDAALVPYPAHVFNAARGPLKVYEYLTGYKPVIAAHTPQLAGIPYVYRADSPDTFLAQIETALNIPVDRAMVDAFLGNCTWDARWQQLLHQLDAAPRPHAAVTAPDTPHWYAAESMTPNIRRYIVVTEQLLEERTRFIASLEADARAKQQHIQRLQQTNPFWRLKSLFD